MHIAVIILLVIQILGLGVILAKHGQTKTGIEAKHNIVLSVVAAAVTWSLLWWAGIFTL